MRNSRLCSLRSKALGGRLLLLLSGAGGLQGFMVQETLAGAGAVVAPPPGGLVTMARSLDRQVHKYVTITVTAECHFR